MKQLTRHCLGFLIWLAFWIVAAFAVIALVWMADNRKRRIFVDTYEWPPGAMAALAKTYPELQPADHDTIGRGLKQFFHAYYLSGYKFVSMPSQAADELWHAFIIDTRAYDAFCKSAFGRFLHHQPASTLCTGQKSNAGLRRVWWRR